MTERTRTSRYPSRTIIAWPPSWSVGAPPFPGFLTRDPGMSLHEYVVAHKAWSEAHDAWWQWFRDRRAELPSADDQGAWREYRCRWCSALIADTHPPTREEKAIVPDLGLGAFGFPSGTPFAILVTGLTRELDASGKPRRDAAGRPYFGPPRRRRFRRGLAPSSEGLPRPFVRHPRSSVLIHCPGCGRVNELAEPRWDQ